MIYTIKKDATMFKKYNKDAKQLSSEKTANMVFRNIKAVNYLANIHIYAHIKRNYSTSNILSFNDFSMALPT